jgi:hypothetical protein
LMRQLDLIFQQLQQSLAMVKVRMINIAASSLN